MALVQFQDEAAVWANLQLPVYTSAGIAWIDFSATVKEAFITDMPLVLQLYFWDHTGSLNDQYIDT